MIRILIAHPSRLVCDSLRNILAKEADICITGCASTIEELYFLLPHANITLLGAELGEENILDILSDIHLTYEHMKVLMIGVEDNPKTILRYIEAGVSGWIATYESLDDVVYKVMAAKDNKALVSPTVAALMMERIAQLAQQPTLGAFGQWKTELVDNLTARECEVLDLIGKGRTNQDIAHELIIERGTVKNHVHNILRKLEVNNRHEAVAVYQAGDYAQRAFAV
jgi:DNA-binding NarL/FixJ family response regulator